jgi:MYXO-CTERM domain-containing protein
MALVDGDRVIASDDDPLARSSSQESAGELGLGNGGRGCRAAGGAPDEAPAGWLALLAGALGIARRRRSRSARQGL